jgi:hypothetical protein
LGISPDGGDGLGRRCSPNYHNDQAAYTYVLFGSRLFVMTNTAAVCPAL